MTIGEKFLSRASRIGPNPSVDLIYTIFNVFDEETALGELAAVAPAVFDGLVLQEAGVEPKDHGQWEGTAKYGPVKPADPPATGDDDFSFDTGGGTQHITQGLEIAPQIVEKRYAIPGEKAFEAFGAIGVSADAVEGVDVIVPIYHFSETHYLPLSVVTDAYKRAVMELTGTTNNAPFRGWAADEVLFQGASGQKRGEQDWQIAFKFAASITKRNFKVGDITVLEKKGWDYLWIRYADVVDANGHGLTKKPQTAYVDKVYESADFTRLLI